MALHDPPAPAVAAPFHSRKNLAMALTGEAGELVEPLKYPAERALGNATKYSKF